MVCWHGGSPLSGMPCIFYSFVFTTYTCTHYSLKALFTHLSLIHLYYMSRVSFELSVLYCKQIWQPNGILTYIFATMGIFEISQQCLVSKMSRIPQVENYSVVQT